MVLEAARRLLVTSGPDAITHLRVAAEAKVMRATVYRHWPTREALLLATALSTDMTPPVPPETLDFRSRLITFLEQLRSDLAGNMVALLAMLVERGERDAELRARKRALIRRALEPVVEVLETARAAGLLAESASPELATAQLVGPRHLRSSCDFAGIGSLTRHEPHSRWPRHLRTGVVAGLPYATRPLRAVVLGLL